MEDLYKKNAYIFKVLSEPNRLKIMRMLCIKEKCACELLKEFNITQPTLSHHMKILCECGLVECKKEGTWNYYKLNYENCRSVISFLQEIIKCPDISKNENLDGINNLLEEEHACNCNVMEDKNEK